MRASPKVKRVQLKISHNDDPLLLGIVSAEPHYKLSLALNRDLKISLKNTKPVTIINDQGLELSFGRFSYTSDSVNFCYELISNRSGKDYFVRKLKNIDFIFRIHDPDNEVNTDELINHLRESGSITAVLNIDPLNIKDKNLNQLIH